MGGCSRNFTEDCCPSSLTCFKAWHRPSRPADQHRVRCLSENNARWRSGGEESCGWRGRLSRSSGGGSRMRGAEQCRRLKAEWDGYSDGLCRTCAPAHRVNSRLQEAWRTPLENLCVAPSRSSQSSHCPYLRASSVTVLYLNTHLPSHVSSQRKALLYAVPSSV